MEPKILKLLITVFSGLMLIISIPVASTQDIPASQYLLLEEMQDEYMEYIKEVPMIVDDYPDFKYQYVYDKEGRVEDVIVEGVDDQMDKRRIEVLIYDAAKAKERMTDIPARPGIYYSTAHEVEPEIGWDSFYSNLYANMDYPEDAKEWGVEGNVYVEFVVNTEGEISNIRTSTDNMQNVVIDRHVEDLKNAAREAVLATSGDWEPGKTRDGMPVPSLLTVPVQFRLELHPSLPAWVR
jgi:hypothetical protein